MSFKVEIEITPDAGGVHCGECDWLGHVGECMVYDGVALDYDIGSDDDLFVRCPACLAAEKAWKERNP